MIKELNKKLKNKQQRNNKGSNYILKVTNYTTSNAITLIALVITIIILLILAGVTINLVLGPEGLLRQAQDATNRYKQAEIDEEEALNNLYKELSSNGEDSESKTELITNIIMNESNINLTLNTKKTLNVTIEPENATNKNLKWSSSNEEVAIVNNGEITTLKEGTTEIKALTTDGSNLNAICAVTVSNDFDVIAKVGDYVKYIVPSKQFTMTTSQTGYTSNQTYKTSDYTGLWRVIYNDDQKGLQIISDKIVTPEYGFSLGTKDNLSASKSAYNNCVSTLNTFCTNYVNTDYATHGRSVGSNPVDSTDKTSKYETLPSAFNGSTNSGCKTDDYNYIYDDLVLRNNSMVSIGASYFYASREIRISLSSSSMKTLHFCVRSVGLMKDDSSFLCGGVFWLNNNNPYLTNSFDGYTISCAVRPCITLKSDLRISNGNGSENEPFELSLE